MSPRKRRRRKSGWLNKASAEMKRKGTEGVFTAKARRAGMSVQAYARKVIRQYKGKTKTAAQLKTLRQAVFARSAGKFRKRRRR